MTNGYGKLLPIGSIVKLKNMDKKVMITGLLSILPSDKNRLKDYSGCFYPEGMIDNKCILFDTEEIDELIYVGYVNDEEREYKKSLNDDIELIKSMVINFREDK